MMTTPEVTPPCDIAAGQGGDVDQLGQVDGFDMWKALTLGKPSPRTEILINIDQQNSNGALHYEGFKLVLGNFAPFDGRFEIPGGFRPYDDLDDLLRDSRAAAVLVRLYGKNDTFRDVDSWRQDATLTCGDATDSNFVSGGTYYLFDISQDPCELHNIAEEQPDAGVAEEVTWHVRLGTTRLNSHLSALTAGAVYAVGQTRRLQPDGGATFECFDRSHG
ncbi:hypothetical protein V5799_029983 [Amblyomma americanum]|uniref:Uncharacterized protein n=1 Tax=Amblyomma americanum TaxID=6943 RepID=A0AAQ4EQ48_AMBAM